MHNELPQSAPANYETPQQHRDNPPPAAEDRKLGSAQPDNDSFDAVSGAPGTIPIELIPADIRPVAIIPAEALPIETQATDFMTKESRPREFRPREFIYREGL